MRLFQTALEALRRGDRSQTRPAHTAKKRLRFESLETRQVLSASPILASTPPSTPVQVAPVLNFLDNTTTNAAGTLAFQPNQIHIAIYGQMYETKQWYYLDASGTPRLTTTATGGDIPTFLMSSLLKGTNPDQYSLVLPETLPGSQYGLQSARAYVAMGTTAANALTLSVNADTSVNAPAANNSFFDFFEFTMNAPKNPYGNLNIDTTNVDQFGIPMTLTVASSDPAYTPTTVGAAASRASIINQYQTFTSAAGDPYAASIDPNTDPVYGPYRIQNPSDVLNGFVQQQEPVRAQTLLPNAISASATSIKVFFAGAFPNPANGSFQVQIDNEKLTVTGAALQSDGSTLWTVVRGQGGTSPAAHNAGIFVTKVGPVVSATQTTITVPGTTGFPNPAAAPFLIQVGTEIMQVTAAVVNRDATTTWTVTRGVDGTTPASYNENQLAIYNPQVQSGLNAIFNSAIDALFAKYENAAPANQLVLQTTVNSITNTYQGQVIQNPTNNLWEIHFVNTTDASDTYDVYYPFFTNNAYLYAGYTPLLSVGAAPTTELGANVASLSPTQMVFNCNGVFADNSFRSGESKTQQTTLADLENQIVSALNRGVALLPGYTASGTGTWADANYYYDTNGLNTTGQAWNQYAQFLHQSSVSLGGKNYGFAYDDQDGHASDIGVSTFTSATVTFRAWGTYTAPTPPGVISLRSFLSSKFAGTSSPAVVGAPNNQISTPPPVAPQVTTLTTTPNSANAPLSLKNFLAGSQP